MVANMLEPHGGNFRKADFCLPPENFSKDHSCYRRMTTVTFQLLLTNPSFSFCGLLVIQHLEVSDPKGLHVQGDILMASCWVLKQQSAIWEPPSQQGIVDQAQVGLLGAQKGDLLFSLGPQRRL